MNSVRFKDYFSSRSADYKKFRPSYPEQLFTRLTALAPGRDMVWDCATGSGQAAEQLANHFRKVLATDASFAQISKAKQRQNILYGVSQGEKAPIADCSIDMVTIAQALHWLSFYEFFGEVARVLKENGIIAAWSYSLLAIDPALDKIIHAFYNDIVGEYWPPERRLVENGYQDIPFPFERVPFPAMSMCVRWSLPELIGYLNTWSAVKLYQKAEGTNPLNIIMNQLIESWGKHSSRRKIEWPLILLVGRKRTFKV